MFEYAQEIIQDRIDNIDYYMPEECQAETLSELQQAITLLENISKDRIVEVLKKHIINASEFSYNLKLSGWQKIEDTPNDIYLKTLEQIANEILNPKPIPCYDKEGNLLNEEILRKESK